jgi:hypothetical protein
VSLERRLVLQTELAGFDSRAVQAFRCLAPSSGPGPCPPKASETVQLVHGVPHASNGGPGLVATNRDENVRFVLGVLAPVDQLDRSLVS